MHLRSVPGDLVTVIMLKCCEKDKTIQKAIMNNNHKNQYKNQKPLVLTREGLPQQFSQILNYSHPITQNKLLKYVNILGREVFYQFNYEESKKLLRKR